MNTRAFGSQEEIIYLSRSFCQLTAMNQLLSFHKAALLTLLLCLISSTRLFAGPGHEMADAANNFLSALTPEQQAKATYDSG